MAKLVALVLATGGMMATDGTEAASNVAYAGYSGCILLQNRETRVVLDPNCGGRVLEYSCRGVNVIMQDADQDGWIYQVDGARIDPCGGRMDIGPEMTIPKHPILWLGRWEGEITGDRSAVLTSQPDSATGVQLVRTFTLSEGCSRLEVTQTIRNVSSEARSYCHWSRTLARPGGICVVPLSNPSRFPKGYIMYGPGPVMNYRPDDPRIRVQDDCLLVTGPPAQPKLGIDSYAGWLAYAMPEDLLFVKRFPTYPDRFYGEMAALTISIYYHPRMCELEPIGPMARIESGGFASFTEVWWLLDMPFPTGDVDLTELKRTVDSHAR